MAKSSELSSGCSNFGISYFTKNLKTNHRIRFFKILIDQNFVFEFYRKKFLKLSFVFNFPCEISERFLKLRDEKKS